MIQANYKFLRFIRFPVFKIPSIVYEEEGLITTEWNTIIDDKRLPFKTLGQRRLRIEGRLNKLDKGMSNIKEMLSSTVRHFIDTNGVTFHYNTTKQGYVKFHSIKETIMLDEYSVIRLKDVNFPIKVDSPPSKSQQWAGILHVDNTPWVLYEYSETNKAPMRKKI